MRRGVFDTLRRGLDNTVVNWPLVAIRLAETILFLTIAAVAILAILIPIVVSAGISLANIDDAGDIENVMLSLMSRWMILIWIFLAVSILMVVFVAIHAFVEAGSARVYVDAERIAGDAVDGPRMRYRLFSVDRWLTGGRDGWWSVFWIYNIAWGLLSLVLLIPLLPTGLMLLIFREQAPVAVLSGCLGLVATLMLLLLGAIVTAIWTNRAIAEWAVRRLGARDALAASWRAIKGDPGRHVLIALAILVVSLAGSTFFASFSFLAGIGESMGNSEVFMLVTLPMRILASLVSSAFSALVTGWYLASYAALAVEQ